MVSCIFQESTSDNSLKHIPTPGTFPVYRGEGAAESYFDNYTYFIKRNSFNNVQFDGVKLEIHDSVFNKDNIPVEVRWSDVSINNDTVPFYVMLIEYNPMGLRDKEYNYDRFDQRDTIVLCEIEYLYDIDDRIIKKISHCDEQLSSQTIYTYSGNIRTRNYNNVLSSTIDCEEDVMDESGKIVVTHYDCVNNTTSRYYTYNSDDQIIRIENRQKYLDKDGDFCVHSWNYTYDNNKLIQMEAYEYDIDEVLNSEIYLYNERGNVSSTDKYDFKWGVRNIGSTVYQYLYK